MYLWLYIRRDGHRKGTMWPNGGKCKIILLRFYRPQTEYSPKPFARHNATANHLHMQPVSASPSTTQIPEVVIALPLWANGFRRTAQRFRRFLAKFLGKTGRKSWWFIIFILKHVDHMTPATSLMQTNSKFICWEMWSMRSDVTEDSQLAAQT